MVDRLPPSSLWLQTDQQLPWQDVQATTNGQTTEKQVHICNPSCHFFGNQQGTYGFCNEGQRKVSINGLCVLPARRQKQVFRT